MSKETRTAMDTFMDIQEKTDATAVAVLWEGKVVGKIIGRWVKSKTYGFTLRMAMRWSYEDKDVITADAFASGCGYNKSLACVESMFGKVGEQLEEMFGVEFRRPEFSDGINRPRRGEKIQAGDYDWGNFAKEILEGAGFTVVIIMGDFR